MLRNFQAALAAEHIKKRGTGLYVVAGIVGSLAPIVRLIVKIFEEKDERITALPVNYFQEYLTECLMVFAPFFFPLVIIITVSRITQLDHKNGGWQLMETQPLQKSSIYFSKFLVVLFANLITLLSLIGVGILCASIGLMFESSSTLDTSFPIVYIIHILFRLFVASLFVTALQFFIAVLMPSFIWSMLIGFFLFMLTGILKAFDYIPDWYPYEIINKITAFKEGSDLGYWFIYTEYLSLLAAILLLCLGFQWFKYKNFKAAFMGNRTRSIQALAVILVFGGLIVYVAKPKQMKPHTRTVLAGKIESDNPITSVYVINEMIRDTLLAIPVVDGKFHFTTNNEILLDNYLVEFASSYKQKVFFGKNDSVHLDLKLKNNQVKFKVTGTRLAENQLTRSSRSPWKVQYYVEEASYLNKPTEFSKLLYDEWGDVMKEKNKSKTVDNYIAREDYHQRDQKLNTVKYLNYWETYVEKRKNIIRASKTDESADIKNLRNQLSLTDESLLSDESYFKYVLQQLTKNDTSTTDINLKQTDAILKLKISSFRDKMLYWQLDKIMAITDAGDLSKQMIDRNTLNIRDQRYAKTLLTKYATQQRLRAGKPAPAFDATTTEGTLVSSTALKGRFNVIMVWVTWNKQNESQSFYFENAAIKFANKGIQFVALSVDEKKDSWKAKAKLKSKAVLQLNANNLAKLSVDYNLGTLPRFVLIDDQGNFVNAYLPAPSEKGFELMIKRALKLTNE
ncbi:MAG: redoxin domain-containing protein [Chitinophagaceae bacterium]|nr:MAG: redoxin domain-containing protein [Chitinophagaceae bacterium]